MDLHAPFRQFRRAPRVALAAVGLLALGIAGVLTLFVPLRSIVLASLPFPHAGELAIVDAPVLDRYHDTFPSRASLTPVLSGIAAYNTNDRVLTKSSLESGPPI